MIYYVRHGETVWNRAGRLQGRRDSPLTLLGVRDSIAYGERLAALLDGRGPASVHASPMGRARQTAALIADVLGVPDDGIEVDDLLAEHDVGDWAGKTWPEVEASHGDTPKRLRDWSHRPPGGETRLEMLERARRWLAGSDADGVRVVVSHGGMSRAFRAAYLGLDGAGAGALPTHAHGRFYRLCAGEVTEVVAASGERAPETLLG